MKPTTHIVALFLLLTLPCQAQTNIVIAIPGSVPIRANPAPEARFYDLGSTNHYVLVISIHNPWNNTNVMREWKMLEAYCRTNDVTLGRMIGSMAVRLSVKKQDAVRARVVIERAIKDKVFDNSILGLAFEE
jgi:hypothetical protein